LPGPCAGPDIIGCEAFAVLYRTDRARALDPKAEQARFVAVEGTIEQQTADRLDAMATRFLHDDSVKAEHVSRWATPPDPLDEP
jgi:hypothetical protein